MGWVFPERIMTGCGFKGGTKVDKRKHNIIANTKRKECFPIGGRGRGGCYTQNYLYVFLFEK